MWHRLFSAFPPKQNRYIIIFLYCDRWTFRRRTSEQVLRWSILRTELRGRAIGGQVKLVEPGMIATEFAGRSLTSATNGNPWMNISRSRSIHDIPLWLKIAFPAQVSWPDVIFRSTTMQKPNALYQQEKKCSSTDSKCKQYETQPSIGD